MRFSYEAAFGKSSANGYERLLLDAMVGAATLFSHRDGVEAAWAQPFPSPPPRCSTGPARAGLTHGLSRMMGKPACPVLRGGSGSNAVPLPDSLSIGGLCLRALSMASKIRTDVREHPSSLVSRKRSL